MYYNKKKFFLKLVLFLFTLITYTFTFSAPKFFVFSPALIDTINYLGLNSTITGTVTNVNFDWEKVFNKNFNYVLILNNMIKIPSHVKNILGNKLIILKQNSIEDIYKNMLFISMLSNNKLALKKAKKWYKDLLSLKNKIKNLKLPFKTFLVIVWTKPYFIAGKNTFLSNLFEIFGLKNVIDINGFPQIDLENLINKKPELLINATLNKNLPIKNFFKNSIYYTPKDVKNLTKPSPYILKSIKNFYRFLKYELNKSN